MIAFGNNDAPWARTTPAGRENELRAQGKLMEKAVREKLQGLENRYGELGAEWTRVTDPARFDAEEVKLRESDLSPTEIVEQLAAIKRRREMKSQFDAEFSAEMFKIVRQMVPAVVKLLNGVLEKVRGEIRDFAPDARGEYWSLNPNEAALTWFTYPMERLRSILESDLEELKRLTPYSDNIVRSTLIDAGVIDRRY